MITLFADNKNIEVEWLEHSDGALTCKIDTAIYKVKGTLYFNVCPTTPCKQVREEIDLIYNSLWLMGCEDLERELHLPYLPYARADRMFEEGNPEPLKVFMETVFPFFSKVHLYDVHNLNEIKGQWMFNTEVSHTDQTSCFQYTCKRHDGYAQKWDYVISPDKGATEKAKKIGEVLGIPVVQASKERDISTGRIIKTELDTTLPVGSRVIIVDDIGDYCGTHIALGEILKEMGCTVDLYVTHLIAPKGLSKLRGIFDKVYCYQTVGGYINKTDVMEFNDGKLY
ncbi:ribose-phosphate pyrophosphokinase [Alteromonas phage vB_AmeM_PT11-V22]|uniref:Ribose-phosphate pyrophosphokinase n=1 Tax=Alteromonas phage vB_AmeM_PT11-V22 TaxID=2704031 RepID=A0A6C0R0P5_9CAUD|nr:ribose-phosphate pyrophosphokinase [Alteromonas phage vB_AmeM_PT11-V22]QHZ59799.1 ribose-phosphate pyrophosphokinase [Alteromonas phage vB_AmeM_PT11-V22]